MRRGEGAYVSGLLYYYYYNLLLLGHTVFYTLNIDRYPIPFWVRINSLRAIFILSYSMPYSSFRTALSCSMLTHRLNDLIDLIDIIDLIERYV